MYTLSNFTQRVIKAAYRARNQVLLIYFYRAKEMFTNQKNSVVSRDLLNLHHGIHMRVETALEILIFLECTREHFDHQDQPVVLSRSAVHISVAGRNL